MQALPGSLGELRGKRRDCPVSLCCPAEAAHQLNRLRTGSSPHASMSCSVYIAEIGAGLWGQGELLQGPLG